MLAEGLVERLAGGYPLRQSGVGHQTHAGQRLPHRSRLAPRATRHTYVSLVSQLPNNRSRIGAVGFRGGAGGALSDAGTGAAAGAVVAAGAG